VALKHIYSNAALVTRRSGGNVTTTASLPTVVVEMLEAMRLSPGMRVLEIGTGTGYNAALLAELVGQDNVTTVEADPGVASEAAELLGTAGYGGVRCVVGDGFDGYDRGAPYDRIVCTVGAGDISPRWLEQMRPGALLLAPLDHAGSHPLVQVERSPSGGTGRIVGWAPFVHGSGRMAADGHWPVQGWTGPSYDELVAQGEVDQHTLWPELRDAGNVNDWDSPVQRFWFFLTLADRRAWRSPYGFGLLDLERGWALVRGDRIGVRGAPELLDGLHGASTEWLAAGMPSLTRYELSFRPASPGLAHAQGREVTRRDHVQVALLDEEIQ
jgi:protein-L-isoaspartate(D-aspartate) O-methyltransferase